jgi:hypothetical protein
MTSNNQDGFVTSAIDSASGMEPYEAFDGSTAIWNNWRSSTSIYSEPVWIKIDLGSSYIVTKYIVKAVTDYYDRAPRTFKFQGSTDSTNFSDLDSQTDQAFSGGTPTRTYEFSNSTSYRYFRLWCHTALYNGNEPYLGELEIYGE